MFLEVHVLWPWKTEATSEKIGWAGMGVGVGGGELSWGVGVIGPPLHWRVLVFFVDNSITFPSHWPKDPFMFV